MSTAPAVAAATTRPENRARCSPPSITRIEARSRNTGAHLHSKRGIAVPVSPVRQRSSRWAQHKADADGSNGYPC